MLRFRLPIISVVFLLSAASPPLMASIRVGPTAVYLSDKNRSGSITISSASSKSVDVRLDLYYGFIRSDPDGKIEVFIDENDVHNAKSCAAWVQINPKRFTLLPGETRTVRFIARPPNGLSNGEYWSRLAITSEEVDTRDAGGDDVISASQKYNVRTIIPISYRKGEAFADVKLMNTVITRDAGIVLFNVDLQPLGNSAYLGNLTLSIRDSGGKEVFSIKVELAVFTMLRRRFDIPGSDMPPGLYKATIKFDTERPDLGADALLVLPKTYTVEFKLP